MSPISTSRKPKRPSTAYNIFFREEHSRIKKVRKLKHTFPATSRSSIDLVAEAWNILSHKEKLMFQVRAARDKVRYVEELRRWRQVQEPEENMQKDGPEDGNGVSKVIDGVPLETHKGCTVESPQTNASQLPGWVSPSSASRTPQINLIGDDDPLQDQERLGDLAEALGDEGVALMIRMFL